MLTLICGLPRAGKTTYSKRYEGKCNIIHVDTMGCTWLSRNARSLEAVRLEEDVVVDGILPHRAERQALLDAYQGDRAVCIWLDTPLEVRKTRKGWSKACEFPFDPPTYDEGWDEIIVIKGEDDG